MTFKSCRIIGARRPAVKETVSRWLLLFLVTSFASALSACALLQGPSPIQVVGAQIIIGPDPVAGSNNVSTHYTVRNAGSKDISTLHISFYMYDTSGNPAPGGNNYFDITFMSTIAPGAPVTGATNLDSSFWYLPKVDLVANQFHIYKVEFSDGSSWTDWLGEYVYPYPVTSSP